MAEEATPIARRSVSSASRPVDGRRTSRRKRTRDARGEDVPVDVAEKRMGREGDGAEREADHEVRPDCPLRP